MNTSEWNFELKHASSTSSLGSHSPRPLPLPSPPTPTTGIADPSGSDRLLHLLVRKPGLLGLIFLPRSAAASGDELRDLSAEGAGPIPILCPASVSPRFFSCFLVAYFDEFVFFFFSGCLGRRSWNRRRSGMCCDVSAQILAFRIPCHLSIFVERGLLLPQQIALYWHDTETLMYCIHSHASNVLYSFTCFFVVMVPFWNRVISCCSFEITMMVN